MEFLKKSKFFIVEQISWIGIIIFILLIGRFLNINIVNIIIVPTLINLILYFLLKNKITSIKLQEIDINDENYNSKYIEKEKESKETTKKYFYKYFIFIYIFYAEFVLLGFPDIVLLSFLFAGFIIFIAYLKSKKSKYYDYINYYLYAFFILLFSMPIIEEILKIINKGV